MRMRWFEMFRLKLMIRKMGIESHFWAPRKEIQKKNKKKNRSVGKKMSEENALQQQQYQRQQR